MKYSIFLYLILMFCYLFFTKVFILMIKFIMLFILVFIFMNLFWFVFIFFNGLFFINFIFMMMSQSFFLMLFLFYNKYLFLFLELLFVFCYFKSFISNIFFYILSILLYNFFYVYRIKSFKFNSKKHIIFKSKVSKIVVDKAFNKVSGCENGVECNEWVVKMVEWSLIDNKPTPLSAVYSFDNDISCFKICNWSGDKSLVFNNNFWKLSDVYSIEKVYDFNCFFKYKVEFDCDGNKYVVISKIGENEFFKESFYNCSTYWVLYEFYGVSNYDKNKDAVYILLNKFTNQFFILGNSSVDCEDLNNISFIFESKDLKYKPFNVLKSWFSKKD